MDAHTKAERASQRKADQKITGGFPCLLCGCQRLLRVDRKDATLVCPDCGESLTREDLVSVVSDLVARAKRIARTLRAIEDDLTTIDDD